MVRKSVRMTAFVMFPVLLCLCAAAKPFFIVLLTEKWAPAIPFFMLFCIFRMPGLITGIDKQLYYALGNSSISLYYEIGLLIAQVSTLFITVPISVPAIAIGAFIVEIIGNVVLFTISDIKYGYKWKYRIHDLKKPFLNGLIAASLVYSVSLLQITDIITLLLQVMVGVISYFVLSKITRDNCLLELVSLLREKISGIKRK